MSSANGRPEILTVSGHFFDFLEPEKNVFDIADIAHALANLCRFNGHCREFYSVAQHCVLVSTLVPPELAFTGLLHDAAEAFLGDVTRPLKRLLPDYKAVEQRVESVVLGRFGLALPYPQAVHDADRHALSIEEYWLMPATHEWTVPGCDSPREHPLHALPPAKARSLFLDRFVAVARYEQGVVA